MSKSAMEIIPGLWLGNIKSRVDQDFLSSRNISVIINCCKPDIVHRYFPDFNLESKLKVKIYDLSIKDHNDITSVNDMFSKLQYITHIINSALLQKKNILVHCYAGKQRSPTVICAFLMWKCNIRALEAIRVVKSRWPITDINYLRSLIRYELKLSLKA